MPDLLRLDLGSGPEPAPGFVGVDRCDAAPGCSVLRADLASGEPWPFEDGAASALRAWHVIEHLPHERVVIGSTAVRRTVRRHGQGPGKTTLTTIVHDRVPVTLDAFFWFFEEAWRVAAPGCRFELAWPHPHHDHADQDPTHCRRIPASTLNYLSVDGRRALRVTQYPVRCDWRVEGVTELASDEALAPFTRPDGSVDLGAARRAIGVFHEIRATLVKEQ